MARLANRNIDLLRKKKKFFNIGIGGYRYTEMRIHPNEPLYAIGLFETVGGAGSEYNTGSDVGHLLREWKKNSEQLLARFDENKDGQIDMEEWQKVSTQIRKLQPLSIC